jgi:hypothetical protein
VPECPASHQTESSSSFASGLRNCSLYINGESPVFGCHLLCYRTFATKTHFFARHLCVPCTTLRTDNSLPPPTLPYIPCLCSRRANTFLGESTRSFTGASCLSTNNNPIRLFPKSDLRTRCHRILLNTCRTTTMRSQQRNSRPASNNRRSLQPDHQVGRHRTEV